MTVPSSTFSGLVPGLVPPQGQDLALADLQEVPAGPVLQPTQLPRPQHTHWGTTHPHPPLWWVPARPTGSGAEGVAAPAAGWEDEPQHQG